MPNPFRPVLALALALAGCAAPSPLQPPAPTLEATLAAEQQMSLQTGSATVLHRQSVPAEAKGTLVMYHGFTAGTWQFDLLAARAVDAGYNVVIPRMPGHGLKDAAGAASPHELPTAREVDQYEAFADHTYQLAAALGAPISVLGLSVGGAVALRVAQKHPEVKRVVAYAPFLRPKSNGWLFGSARAIDFVAFGLGDGMLSAVPWGWGSECEADMAAGKRPGHCSFSLGTIHGAAAFGDRVIHEAASLQSPTQFFVTGSDDAAEEAAIADVFSKSGGAGRHGWHYYPKEEGIPHPMLHPVEDKGKGHTPALYDMTMLFLDHGTMSNRGTPPQ